MNIIEVGILQVSAMMAGHSYGKRRHSDDLPFRDQPSVCLQFDKAIAEINDGIAM